MYGCGRRNYTDNDMDAVEGDDGGLDYLDAGATNLTVMADRVLGGDDDDDPKDLCKKPGHVCFCARDHCNPLAGNILAPCVSALVQVAAAVYMVQYMAHSNGWFTTVCEFWSV